MKIDFRTITLNLKDPFLLAYGQTSQRENVFVRIIDDDGRIGWGEAAVVPYYGETPNRITRYFEQVNHYLQQLPESVWGLNDLLENMPPGDSSAALAALDMALHDLWGKYLKQPLYRLWGLNPSKIPLSSYTLSMSEDDAHYRDNLRQVAHFPILKLKLGSGDVERDLAFVRMAQEITTARLGLDANGGWTAQQTLELLPRLPQDLLFIEQPVPRDDLDGWRKLRADRPITAPPFIADESVQGLKSLHGLIGLVDGINVKLAKCGGLHIARKMIDVARFHDLKILLGCMVESSLAVTAAAHLAPLADFCDLDGMLLIDNDPFYGATNQNGRIDLPQDSGLGVQERMYTDAAS